MWLNGIEAGPRLGDQRGGTAGESMEGKKERPSSHWALHMHGDKRRRAWRALATNSGSGLLEQKVKEEVGNGKGGGRRYEWWHSESRQGKRMR